LRKRPCREDYNLARLGITIHDTSRLDVNLHHPSASEPILATLIRVVIGGKQRFSLTDLRCLWQSVRNTWQSVRNTSAPMPQPPNKRRNSKPSGKHGYFSTAFRPKLKRTKESPRHCASMTVAMCGSELGNGARMIDECEKSLVDCFVCTNVSSLR
jgi:hypothetical protein